MDFAKIAQDAHEAGLAAVETANVQIIGIKGADYTFPICGFAWIAFAGNTAWGRWAKAQGLASKAYPSGLSIWVSDFGQSYDRKLAYARGYAKVLQDHGIKAYGSGRLD